MRRLKQLARRAIPSLFLNKLEKIYRLSRGLFWQVRFGFPARKTRVIAVTGTNGKSTTCAYINEVLKVGGYKTAVLTTVFYEIAGGREPNLTHYTISKQSIVQSFFAQAKKSGVDFVILEVTSHALDQGRIMGVPVEIGVITNLTQDHLDYHKNMEQYAGAKARLLSDYGAKWAVLNGDDQWHDFFAQAAPSAQLFSYGQKSGYSVLIKNVSSGVKGSQFAITSRGKSLKLTTELFGEFNVYNAAAAASVGLILKINGSKITRGIASLKSLDGRMELINPDQEFGVYVDFSITPDALEKALSSLKRITKGSVRVVFGATGDRDKDKRPKMGAVAAGRADFIYLTDDETYTEDPDKIREAVYEGIKQAKGAKKTKVIADRKQAIESAIADAKAGDTVLLTGIGHEDSRNMGGVQITWDEKQIANAAIRSK